MSWMRIFGWISVVLGISGLLYGEVSDTAAILTIWIGVYLLVNAEKKK